MAALDFSSLVSLFNLEDRLRWIPLFSLGDLLDAAAQFWAETVRFADLGLGVLWCCSGKNLGDLRGVWTKEFLGIFTNGVTSTKMDVSRRNHERSHFSVAASFGGNHASPPSSTRTGSFSAAVGRRR